MSLKTQQNSQKPQTQPHKRHSQSRPSPNTPQPLAQPNPAPQFTLQLSLSYILGTNTSPTQSPNIHVYKHDQLIYYLKNMFIKYNILSKKYRIIYEQQKEKQNSKQNQQILQCKQIDRVKEQNGNNVSFVDRSVLVVSKYFCAGGNSLFVVIKKIDQCYYASLYWTQSGNSATLIKLSQDKRQVYVNCTYHPKKGYLYLIYKLTQQQCPTRTQKQQYLKILQLSSHLPTTTKSRTPKPSPQIKTKVLINSLIRRTGGVSHQLQDMIVGDDHTQVYMFGLDYFRLWTVFYNQKTVKESNYRNIERNIKKNRILSTCYVPDICFGKSANCYKDQLKSDNMYLLVTTQKQILFIHQNQLIHIAEIPYDNPFTTTYNNDNTQLALEQSLNQIYKTKFNIDGINDQDEDEEGGDEEGGDGDGEKWSKAKMEEAFRLSSASKAWVQVIGKNQLSGKSNISGSNVSNMLIQHKIKQKQAQKSHKVIKFCGAFNSTNIFIYKICPDFSIRVQSSINPQSPHNHHSLPHPITSISTCPESTLFLLTDSTHKNYINNRLQDSQNTQIDCMYIGGHSHVSNIRSLSCPQIMNYLVSVSDDGYMKIWNKGDKDRNVFVDLEWRNRVLEAVVHPCGLIVICNFGVEIKVYAIVSGELEEIVAVKTHGYCTHIQLSKSNNFLVANEKSTIKIYDPFTLHTLGRLQPQDLRLQYRQFHLSQNGQYILFQCCNNKVYRYQTNSIFHQTPQKQFYQPEIKPDQPILCHRQSEQYTCFYFNFGSVKSNTIMMLEKDKQKDNTSYKEKEKQRDEQYIKNGKNNNKNDCNLSYDKCKVKLDGNNIFVGFTKSKFMVVYANFGEQLVAQFPVVNGVYATDIFVGEQLIFVGTNRGSILSFKWPFLQSHFQIFATQQKTQNGATIARLKMPKCLQQFKVWRDSSPITCLYRVPNKNQIVVGASDGTIGFVNYSTFRNGVEVYDSEVMAGFSGQRKKMMESINNLKLVKIAEVEKITKLIQKTQHDIQKLQFELQNERQRKKKQLIREQEELRHMAQKRKKVYTNQRTQKFLQLQNQLRSQQKQYADKKSQLQKLLHSLQHTNNQKSSYQKYRIQQLKSDLQKQKKSHKQRILHLMQTHKQNIQQSKNKNLKYIRRLQEQFQEIVKMRVKRQENIQEIVEISQEELIKNEEISIQATKVEELKGIIKEKRKELEKIEEIVKKSKSQDEQVQKIFEKNLQKYNQYRYQNLVLHSELLKIQNQLHQRKQILCKKDQIINIAFHQKETNQTFKQFVSGAICGLEDQKGKAYQEYIQKQENLKMLFDQLTVQINKAESKKLKLGELQQALKIYEKQKVEKQKNIRQSVQKLKDLKKYLLVQGISEDSEHKKFYQEQQKLLSTIHWLQKRFKMNSLNEKKLTILKKSNVKQVILQNKNLLQQCNKLRQQGIIYENQIGHLGKKLAEVNQILEYDRKVKNQNSMINKQTQQLNQIRNMFKKQLEGSEEQLFEAKM